MRYELLCMMAGAAVLGACSSAGTHSETDTNDNGDPELREAMNLPGFVSWRRADVGATTPESSSARANLADVTGTGRLLNGTGAVFTMQTKKGNYTIEIDADAMGAANDITDIEGAPPGEIALRGWSNGFDSRVRTTGTTLVFEVGQLSTIGCSGTLISPRVVRTAAHCIITHTAGGGTVPALGTLTFNYRRDGNAVAAVVNDVARWVGVNYIPSGCATRTATDYWSGYRANFETCTWSDWGYIVLPNNWWAATGVSWMGRRRVTNADLGLVVRATGYPACGTANQPINGSGCVNGGQYEDRTLSCTIAQWTNGNSKWLSGCDQSVGNSGGPAWQVRTRQLLGHFQWEDCLTCPAGSPNRANPNRFLGYDQTLWDFEAAVINQNPAF